MRKAILFTASGLFIGTFLTLSLMTSSFSDAASVFHPPLKPEQARKEVEQAIEHFRRAMVERRPEWILSDSAAELTFGHSNGIVQSRKEFADVVRTGVEIFKRVDITNRHLTVSGNVAIERHHFSADIVYKGSLRTFELEVVEVWKKSDRWRLIARQAVKI